MPIYEYVCRQCGGEMERLQRISDAPLTDCPACGETALVKKVSAAAFRLKGGGWYETDFKADGKRNLTGDKKPDGKSGESKPATDSTSETKAAKPADKPAGKPAAASKAAEA